MYAGCSDENWWVLGKSCDGGRGRIFVERIVFLSYFLSTFSQLSPYGLLLSFQWHHLQSYRLWLLVVGC